MKNLINILLKNRKNILYGCFVGSGIIILVLIILVLDFKAFFNSFELYLYDFRTKVYVATMGKKADPDVILLVHNDDSENIINNNTDAGFLKWPFPRYQYAELLRFLRRANTNVNAFDVSFSGETDPYNDGTFARAIEKNGNVILGYIVPPNEFFKKEVLKGKYLNKLTKYIFAQEGIAGYNNYYFVLNIFPFLEPEKIKITYERVLASGLTVLDEINNDFKKVVDEKEASLPILNYYERHFKYISPESYRELGYESIVMMSYVNLMLSYESGISSKISYTYFHPMGTLKRFLEATRNIGLINVETTSAITETIREYKTFFKYKDTDTFMMSLPLVTVYEALGRDIDFSFSRNLLNKNLHFDNKTFRVCDNINIFPNWRSGGVVNETFNLKSVGSMKITTYPLARALIYEKFETMDPLTGIYITPEEENFYWQSHYNQIVSEGIANTNAIYIRMKHHDVLTDNDINIRYDTYTFLDPFKEGLSVEGIHTNAAIFDYKRPVALKDSIIDGGYYNHLLRIIRGDRPYQFLNYLNDIKYRHTYYDQSKYYNYVINTAYYPYAKNPKIAGIPLYDLYRFNEFMYKTGLENTDVIDVWPHLKRFQDLNLHPHNLFNKIVIIGESRATGDVHSTSVAKVFPGPEIVATAVDNFLNDGTPDSKTIGQVPFWFDLIVIVFFAGITIFSIVRASNYLLSFVNFMAILFIFIMINFGLFIFPFIRLWVNMVYPITFIILAAVFAVTYKNMVIDKDKKQIRSLFGKFVSPQILEAVIENPDIISTQTPRKKEMSVLFSDIRDFTSRSETIDPLELIEQLNTYLTEMVEVIILNYNGTLDKFMGDAVMAFWGDPIPLEDHARRAVLTALAMRKHLELLNKHWEKQGKTTLKIGIGVNSGEMIVGHMGSPRLIDYTVLGDNVNVASRIEGLNKQFGTDIIISESTYEQVKDIVDVEDMGYTHIKGKAKEIRVYSVIDLKPDASVEFDKSPVLYTIKDE
jgi:class 3 adenylate cyclase